MTRTAEDFRRATAARLEIDLSGAIALSHVAETEQCSPRELARRLGLTSSAITALLDRLERAGLVVRTAHPTDRRKMIIVLTDRGTCARGQMVDKLARSLDNLSVDRMAEVAAVFEEVANALDAELASSTPPPTPPPAKRGQVIRPDGLWG